MTRRTALVTQAAALVGPALCVRLAASGHNLVLHHPDTALLDRLAAFDVDIEAVWSDRIADHGTGSLASEDGWIGLVDIALARFGRIDAAAISPQTGNRATFHKGAKLDTDIAIMEQMTAYLPVTMMALKALVPPMRDAGGGQILVFTSAAGARPEALWSIYGAVRAGQNFFVRAIALEHARDKISINAIGTKNVAFPGFPLAPADAIVEDSITRGDWSVPLEAETPLGRLGTASEVAAFCMPLLDGSSAFQTGQFFAFSGGWDTAGGA